uniref:Uncharacterized protein n=1 Tax=Knipowitschia caucasica TaxID=637954 RepID=A0AAV2IYT9_KNICA
MTLANLDDFEKGLGDVEKKFVECFREGIFCGHRLTHVDEHGFSALRAQYIGEIMKSIKKRFPSGDVSHISDLDTVLNASRFPNTNSALQEYGLDAVERLADFYGAHPNAAVSLVEKERMVRDFRSVKRVLAGSVRKRTGPAVLDIRRQTTRGDLQMEQAVLGFSLMTTRKLPMGRSSITCLQYSAKVHSALCSSYR